MTGRGDREAALELLRRSVDLRIDGEGRWFHDGEPFVHPRLIAFFNRGLDLHPESGEPVLRVGDTWCYVHADDTPFVVRRLTEDAGVLRVVLNTEEALPLAVDAFERRGDHFYVRLDERRVARLDRATHNGLWEVLDEGADGRLTLYGRPVRTSLTG